MSSVTNKIRRFFSRFPSSGYKKNEVIATAQKNFPFVYFLKKGYVRLCKKNTASENLTFHIFRPGSFFPLLFILDSSRKEGYFFQAMTPVEVYAAPTKEVLKFVKENSEVSFLLLQRFAGGLQGLMTRIELSSHDSFGRLISLLAYLARVVGFKDANGITLKPHLTHKDMGLWIGTARETVTRFLKKLEKKGVLVQHGHLLTIKDLSN